LANTSEDVLLATFLHFASEEKLIEDEVCLLEIEDDIKFAHIAIIFVHLLDKAMHDLKSDELVIGRVYSGDEKEGGIATVHDFGVFDSQSAMYRRGGTRAVETDPCTQESCTSAYDEQELIVRHL
jgi:hypothetical protein